MKNLRRLLEKIIAYVLIILMAANVLNVIWQVFTRFVLRHPSSFSEELARYLLVWVGVLGGAYAVGKKIHLAIDILPTKLTGKSQIGLGLFIQFCILAFAVFVLFIGGWRLVDLTLSLNQISAALRIKLGYVYLVLPISGLLIAFFTLDEIIKNLRVLRQSAEKPQKSQD
jgi:TRAP-type C4-dicarboxylate transport system permease small subunit